MNVLILQGPNLNLLGTISADSGNQLTLDKLNKAIRKHIYGKEIKLKFFQTHKQFQCVNFLQRNRNWANGLLMIPTSWAKYDWTVADTLNVIKIPTSMVYFEKPFFLGCKETDSILTGKYINSFSGQPIAACINGIDHLLSQKR